MAVAELAICGRGLHSGALCSVRLRAAAGPVRFCTAGGLVTISRCQVRRTDQGVELALGEHAGVDLVEHLLAALGGLRLFEGLSIEVTGPELPLLDGGARAWVEALQRFELAARAPRLHVARRCRIALGQSEYLFTPAAEPSLEVEIDFAEPGIGRQVATWDGSPGAFVESIAPARTFGFARDAARLHSAGRALYVDRRAVLVLDDTGNALPDSPAATPQEHARHKLLDLIGDLYLYGGPPRGHIRVLRPGHGPTHRAVPEALRLGGLIAAEPWPQPFCDTTDQ